jgi:hypothetical protein
MIFQITRHKDDGVPEVGIPPIDLYGWRLEKASGEVVCQSARSWDSERETRSAISAAKKSLAGAGRCKVVSPNAC